MHEFIGHEGELKKVSLQEFENHAAFIVSRDRRGGVGMTALLRDLSTYLQDFSASLVVIDGLDEVPLRDEPIPGGRSSSGQRLPLTYSTPECTSYETHYNSLPLRRIVYDWVSHKLAERERVRKAYLKLIKLIKLIIRRLLATRLVDNLVPPQRKRFWTRRSHGLRNEISSSRRNSNRGAVVLA